MFDLLSNPAVLPFVVMVVLTYILYLTDGVFVSLIYSFSMGSFTWAFLTAYPTYIVSYIYIDDSINQIWDGYIEYLSEDWFLIIGVYFAFFLFLSMISWIRHLLWRA